MKQFRLKVVSGEHTGRFIGQRLGGGIITSPEIRQNPPVDIPKTTYALHVQERAATQFSENNAMQVQIYLRALGYELELVEVAYAD
jgi:hypothetical protein